MPIYQCLVLIKMTKKPSTALTKINSNATTSIDRQRTLYQSSKFSFLFHGTVNFLPRNMLWREQIIYNIHEIHQLCPNSFFSTWIWASSPSSFLLTLLLEQLGQVAQLVWKTKWLSCQSTNNVKALKGTINIKLYEVSMSGIYWHLGISSRERSKPNERVCTKKQIKWYI